MKLLTTVFSHFVALIFPDSCYGCGNDLVAQENIICTRCRVEIPKTNTVIEPENAIKLKFAGRVDFKYAISYAQYTKSGIVGKLLKALKYNGITEVGTTLGQWLGHEMLVHGYADKFDIIIPVPLHKNKQARRGYNQAEIFGESLAHVLGCEMKTDAVLRIKFTQSQTKFSGEARWDNVKDIFKTIHPELIKNKRILLVDDVVTTGATIEALANEILKHQPKEISLAMIADADY